MKIIIFLLATLIIYPSFGQNKRSLLRDGNDLYLDSLFNEAELKYRKSLEKDQDYFNASFNLADAVYKQNRFSESTKLFKALEKQKISQNNLAKVYHNLGNSLFKEKQFNDAISAYKDALRINPNDNDTRHNLALANKYKKEQENQEQENQEQENQEQENQEQENQEQENQEQEREQISKKDVEKILEAINEKEKEIQEKLQKKNRKSVKVKILKDW